MERTKQPIGLHIGLDASETLYGRVSLKETRLCVRGIREQGGLLLIFAALGLNPEAIEMISGLSDVRMRLGGARDRALLRNQTWNRGLRL